MKRTNQILWGVVLVLAGLVLACNALGLTDINLFFDGWWTLFIIIPCGIGLLSGKEITGNLIGLGIGVALLLACRDILDFDLLWKLLVPAIIVIFGIKLIFGSLLDRRNDEKIKQLQSENCVLRSGTAVFSGEKLNFSGETFEGADLNAVFGGVDCDLRNAIITHDCVISASAIFGGVDIFVPANVNVKVSSNSIFGGTSNKAAGRNLPDAPTLYVRSTCLFGGVDIK